MGVYGVSTYGAGVYGTLTASSFSTTFTVAPRGYDTLFLNWTMPGGNWSDMQLVRSSYGYPTTPTDGLVLFDEPDSSAPVSFLDGDPVTSPGPLQPGRFYYYTLFVYSTDDAVWVPIGTTMGLVTVDHGYRNNLWGHLPQVYKTADWEIRDVSQRGPLERFVGLLSYQLDRLRSEVDTLLDVGRIDRVSGGLLPQLSQSLGVTYEAELGMRLSRGIAQNSVYLAKIKGTRPGVEGIASAYTGFGATAVVGKNLLLDYNSSGFRESVGQWTALFNATLAHETAAVFEGGVPGTGTLKVTAGNAGGDAYFTSGTFAARTLTPISPSTNYTASLYVRHGGTARTVFPTLDFYDIGGNVVATFSGAASADTAAWVRRTVTGLAPASARWCAVWLTITGPANGEVHRFSAAQIEAGTGASTWESARRVNIYLEADRVNLMPNPSFEVNVSGWGALANCVISRQTINFRDGAAAMRMASSAAGTMQAYTSTAVTGIIAEEPYTFSAYFLRAAGSARQVRVSVNWQTSGGAFISNVPGTAVTEVVGTWTRASLTSIAPPTAARAQVILQVDGTTVASEDHFVDSVLVEQTEFVKPYFDASLYPPSDYLWAGTAHNSASHLYPRRTLKDDRLQTILPLHVPAGLDFATFYGVAAPASSI
jgi:phage tail-like protein